MTFVKKIAVIVFSVVLLILVIMYLEPPATWTTASIFQIMAIFLPLLIIATLSIDFVFNYLPHSFIVALGFTMGLAFYAVNQLNFLTITLVLLTTVFFFRVFPKMKLPRFRLTSGSKIPKLHIHKPEPRRLRRLRRIRNA